MTGPLRMPILLAGLCIWVLGAHSAHADFTGCLQGIRVSAKAQGISDVTFARAAENLQANPEVMGFSKSQPEFSTPIWDYLAGLVDEERVSEGRALMAKWSVALGQVEERFGVDRATTVAVWGVESDYGKGFGFRPVLQSLATLACSDSGRRDYFRSEFLAALKIVQGGDVDQEAFKGSWAGAFGHTQFMPSTFLRLAVDMDGDGRRDIIGSVPDALGSTANFLRNSGWVSGLGWGFEVKVPAGYSGPTGRGRKEAMSAWAARGIVRADGASLGEGTAGLLLPAGPEGPGFLVTRNFDAIYSYNAAESYGLAIAILSDRLRGAGPLVTPWPTSDPGLSRAERRELQTLLAARGYTIGNIDGVLGTKTREAIVDFQSRNGTGGSSGHAGKLLLDALRGGAGSADTGPKPER